MAYADQIKQSGRKAIRLIEVDLQKCAEVFGRNPCAGGEQHSGTAQAGGASTITLDTGASASDDAYNTMLVYIESGTGAGQERTISDYVGSTKVATVSLAWSTNPDATSVFRITDPNSATACYNTQKTCKDKPNYNGTDTLTVKLSEISPEHQFDMGAIPCVEDIDTAHTQIEPARQKAEENNARSAGMAIKCVDFPHHDRGIDPYVANRSYNPTAQGTYFGKLKSRNPYYQGAEVRVKTGYWASGYDSGNFKTRTYYLEKFEGPDKQGRVKFIAQDPSRKLDDKRVTCPILTTGTLNATLTVGETTSFTVTGDEDLYPTGGGRVAIEDEVIIYTSGLDNGDGTYTFSTLTRGQDNSAAAEHASGEGVQLCARFDNQTARQIAYTLYTTYGGIAAGLIDTTQWDSIADIWLQVTYSRTIVEPTGVKQLLGETFLQMAYFVWWDEEAGKFYLEAIRPPDYDSLDTYTQGSHLIDGTVEQTEAPERRVTQVHVYYQPRTPFAKDKNDFSTRVRGIDAAAESSDQYGDMRILEILGNWLDGDSQAAALHGRMLNRFRDNLQIVKFHMDAKDSGLVTGNHCYIQSDKLQDEEGANGTTLLQVVQRDEIKTGSIYAYRTYDSNYFGRYGCIAPVATPNYSVATQAQKDRYAYISAAGGDNYSDGGTAHKII